MSSSPPKKLQELSPISRSQQLLKHTERTILENFRLAESRITARHRDQQVSNTFAFFSFIKLDKCKYIN